MRLVDIGGGNVLADDQIIMVSAYGSAMTKNRIDKARQENMLLDTTGRNKTRTTIFTKSGYVVLSRTSIETIIKRVNGEEK